MDKKEYCIVQGDSEVKKKCCREIYCTCMSYKMPAAAALTKNVSKKPFKWQDDSNFHSQWDLLSYEKYKYSHAATFHKEITKQNDEELHVSLTILCNLMQPQALK